MMLRNKFVHLVFPPVWPTEIPYLSLPALRASLNGKENILVKSLDMNIWFWEYLSNDESLTKLWNWIRKKIHQGSFNNIRTNLGFFLRLKHIADTDLKSFLYEVKKRQSIDYIIQAGLIFYFSEVILGKKINTLLSQWEDGYDYHDPLFNSISLSEYTNSAEDITEIISSNGKENPFLEILPKLYLGKVKDEIPDLLCLSITASNQVIPGLSLASWVKKNYSNCRVVMGGQWCTHIIQNKKSNFYPLFSIIDGIVIGEGEKSLNDIVDRIAISADWNDIPNFFYLQNGKVVSPKEIIWDFPLDELPTPDFSDIPLNLYKYSRQVPLQASRGCNWAKCKFCTYKIVDKIYRTRSIPNVTKDIEEICHKYPVNEIAFTDSVLDPKYFESLSDNLIKKRISIKWRGFGRFDHKYSKDMFSKMAKAGCHFIIWGLESGSNKILKKMCKGNNQKIISENLKASSDEGIHNRVCLIYGYPGETLEDIDITISFIRKYKEFIHSIAFCYFTPLHGTEVANQYISNNNPELDLSDGLMLEIDSYPTDKFYLKQVEQKLRSLWLEIHRFQSHST